MESTITTPVEAPETYWVPSFKVEVLKKNLAKLNRRAKKLDCKPIEVSPTGNIKNVQVWVEVLSDHPSRVRITDGVFPKGFKKENFRHVSSYDLVEYRIEASHVVKLSGWDLLARVEHAGVRNFVLVVPGKEAPEWAYTVECKCDHCETSRRRKDTFLVKATEDNRSHPIGKVLQVGSTCLKDFLGHVAPENILQRAEWITSSRSIFSDLDDDGCDWRDSSVRDHFQVSSFTLLRHVAALVRTIGWTSSKAAYDFGKTSTKDEALGWIFTTSTDEENSYNDLTKGGVNEEDDRLAKDALEWARETLVPTSDYEENLKTAAVNEEVTLRAAGILASLIVAYTRYQEKEINRTQLAKSWKPGHVGTIGKREVFKGLKVLGKKFIDSDWGASTLYQFQTPTGQQVSWFCTGNTPLELGDVVDLKATVKKHGNYKGVDQTLVNRCKVENLTRKE